MTLERAIEILEAYSNWLKGGSRGLMPGTQKAISEAIDTVVKHLKDTEYRKDLSS